MRVWNVPPQVLCRQHLLGEHLEHHMLAGTIAAGRSIAGYVAAGLVDTSNLQARHDALAAEIAARGWKHASPMHYEDVLHVGHVDTQANLAELSRRCTACAQRIADAGLAPDAMHELMA